MTQRWMLLATLLVAILLAGLPLPAFAAEPIKIGMVVPLTGPIADAGRYGTQGAKLLSRRSIPKAACLGARSN